MSLSQEQEGSPSKRAKSESEPALPALADVVPNLNMYDPKPYIDNVRTTSMLAGCLGTIVKKLLRHDQWKQHIDAKWTELDVCKRLVVDEDVHKLLKEGGWQALFDSGPCSFYFLLFCHRRSMYLI